MSQPASPLTGPQSLIEMQFAMMPSRVLAAGVQLDLFSRLADGIDTVPALAVAVGASERGLRMLLDALVALRLLAKTAGRYALTPLARAHLVRSSPDYVGAILETDDIWNAWSRLTEAVKTGRPVDAVERRARAETFFPVLIRSLHVTNRAPAERLAAALSAHRAASPRAVLDVACGSGVWGIALAEADPAARVIAHDFPAVLAKTRSYIARHGLAGRFDYMPGDLNEMDFGIDRFDVAILGNIVHSEGEASSRALFARLHRALRPGGRLAIADLVPNEERTGPPAALLFALNMLVNTERGDTFTLSEYTAWLHEAGFARVETVPIGPHIGTDASAILGVKA
ncbi:MAG: class I SAM-dependent methyltransferase [Rhodospirillales bacterium]|nr:class I SAM-dependent methyltransferase [Rhodospirillales bacterium]